MRREGLGGRAARPAVASPFGRGGTKINPQQIGPEQTGSVTRSFYARRWLRATLRAAVVTPDEKENAPAPFSAEVSAAPFSAELAAGVSDGSECKQS